VGQGGAYNGGYAVRAHKLPHKKEMRVFFCCRQARPFCSAPVSSCYEKIGTAAYSRIRESMCLVRAVSQTSEKRTALSMSIARQSFSWNIISKHYCIALEILVLPTAYGSRYSVNIQGARSRNEKR
jgi:hypothetical protein